MKCRVWAPFAKRVELVFSEIDARVAMHEREAGYFEIEDVRFDYGVRYAFSLDGGPPLPDPRSLFQPNGVHAPSELCNLADFEWTDSGFHQAPQSRAVVYELHVGTFSPEGTYLGVIDRLDHLCELGVTHIELMPVAAFPGRRGWGYDAVSWFAPFAEYGKPADLMRLVDACHARGLAVLLDVVYNHLGPSGNYLGQFGPYFTDRYSTPWGPALNFDTAGSDQVRRFVCDNALHWLEHYHFDGLRLDAVHAIFDQSAVHILEQLSREVQALAKRKDKPLVLIAESHLNDPRFVYPVERGGLGLDGQWSDDFHHALFTVLTGELQGYYADFGKLEHLADALARGFTYRGQYSAHRQHSYGREPHGLSGRHFTVFWQNHDQVGNRAKGDRPDPALSFGQRKIAAALTLLSPHVPLIFMGQEWGTNAPFQYFTDHSEPELARAVREGRRREFAEFGWDASDVVDPQAETSYRNSQLDFSEREREPCASLYSWYQKLLSLRKSEPALTSDGLDEVSVHFDEAERWLCLKRSNVAVLVNFDASFHHLDRTLLAPLDTEPCILLSSETGIKLTETEIALPGHSVLVTRAGR